MKTYNTMLRDFANIANAANRAFSAYDYAQHGGSNGQDRQPTQWNANLPVDIAAAENEFVITAYLPGVQPEEVEITMENEELTIRGQFPKASEETKWVKRELFHGAFARRLAFNVPVNVDGIRAEFSNGVLTLTVPKAEEVKPKQIKVLAK
jgi:HSP20 family protein